MILRTVLLVSCIVLSQNSGATPDISDLGLTPKKRMQLNNSPEKKSDLSCSTTEVPDRASSKAIGHDCLISLSTLDKLRTKGNLQIVDVRTPEQFNRFHIANSINIPEYLIKTKKFLRQSSFVLVNEGHNLNSLRNTCEELRQSGFSNATVLEGGLFSWNANNRSLEGDIEGSLSLNRLSASELFESRQSPNWFVIDVSSLDKKKDVIKWLPTKVTTLPLTEKSNSVTAIMSVIQEQRKKSPSSQILLIGNDDAAYERIDVQLTSKGMTSGVLRLSGGIGSYREHIGKQLALWNQQKMQNQPRKYEICRG